MNSLALSTERMAGPNAVLPASLAKAHERVAAIPGGVVESPIGGGVADLPAVAKLRRLMAIPARVDEKLKFCTSQGIPTVTAVMHFCAWLALAAFANASRSLANTGANESPTRAGEIVGVRSKAHAGQEKITLLIRGELFAHCGDSKKRTDCAAALVASVVTTITVGIRANVRIVPV